MSFAATPSNARIDAWLPVLSDPGVLRVDLPDRPLEAGDLTPLRRIADRHNVLPATTANLRRLAQQQGMGRVVAGPAGSTEQAMAAFLRDAAMRLAQHAAVSVYLRRQAAAVAAGMGRHGVAAVLLRGAAFADRLYRPPTLRPFVDIDLLVSPTQVELAGQVMRELAFQPRETPMKYSAGYGEQAWHLPHDRGCVVEVHSDVVNSPTLRRSVSVRLEDLALAETVPGQPPALTAGAMLLVAAVHAATSHGFEKLQHVCDVAQLARGAAGPIEVDWLREAARATGGWLSVAVAVDLAARVLRDPASEGLLAELRRGWAPRLCRVLLSPRLVVAAQASGRVWGSWRRQLFRQMLKSGRRPPPGAA